MSQIDEQEQGDDADNYVNVGPSWSVGAAPLVLVEDPHKTVQDLDSIAWGNSAAVYRVPRKIWERYMSAWGEFHSAEADLCSCPKYRLVTVRRYALGDVVLGETELSGGVAR